MQSIGARPLVTSTKICLLSRFNASFKFALACEDDPYIYFLNKNNSWKSDIFILQLRRRKSDGPNSCNDSNIGIQVEIVVPELFHMIFQSHPWVTPVGIPETLDLAGKFDLLYSSSISVSHPGRICLALRGFYAECIWASIQTWAWGLL